MDNSGFSAGSRYILVLAAFVIVVAGIKAAESILVMFLLSGFFAIICAPPFLILKNRGVPSWLSLMLVVVGITGIQFIFVSIVGSSVAEFTGDLPRYQQRVQQLTTKFVTFLAEYGIDVPQDVFRQYFDPSMALKLAANALGGLGGVLSNVFLIILTVIFMLFEGVSLPNKLHYAFGEGKTVAHIDTFLNDVKRYMSLKTVISLITGTLIYIWLMILGVDYPLLWALVAFLFNFVPNIGSIIAAVPAVLLALVQLDPLHALLTAVGYVVVNTVMGNIVEPRFMGKGLGLSTLVVFLSLVFWGWVLGPVGMLLSIPLTIMLKMALENNPETRWISILMGGDVDISKEQIMGDLKLAKAPHPEAEEGESDTDQRQ
ncbi:MAG: AI-2E family transporter [Pseudomonadales bacterium]|nr:AI-2E family transporter [Pseudomonadales bacterium]